LKNGITVYNCATFRRGSSASLTIDLGPSENAVIEPSPIYENDVAEELEYKKLGRLTRRQLRHFDVTASLSTIYAEFAVAPTRKKLTSRLSWAGTMYTSESITSDYTLKSYRLAQIPQHGLCPQNVKPEGPCSSLQYCCGKDSDVRMQNV
uniref:Metalloprotease n=1 Tax=Gongylonema pulchrum TaxID=637853 RepID=A0A183ERZ0_9BILA